MDFARENFFVRGNWVSKEQFRVHAPSIIGAASRPPPSPPLVSWPPSALPTCSFLRGARCCRSRSIAEPFRRGTPLRPFPADCAYRAWCPPEFSSAFSSPLRPLSVFPKRRWPFRRPALPFPSVRILRGSGRSNARRNLRTCRPILPAGNDQHVWNKVNFLNWSMRKRVWNWLKR